MLQVREQSSRVGWGDSGMKANGFDQNGGYNGRVLRLVLSEAVTQLHVRRGAPKFSPWGVSWKTAESSAGEYWATSAEDITAPQRERVRRRLKKGRTHPVGS